MAPSVGLGVIYYLAYTVYTAYYLMMSAQGTNYSDVLSAVLAEAQMQGMYSDMFFVRFSKNSHLLQMVGADCDGDRGAHTQPPATCEQGGESTTT